MVDLPFKPYGNKASYHSAERTFVGMLLERLATAEGRNLSDQEAQDIWMIWHLLVDIQVVAAEV